MKRLLFYIVLLLCLCSIPASAFQLITGRLLTVCTHCTSAQYDVLKETSDEDDANFGAGPQCANCVDNYWNDDQDDDDSLDFDYDASGISCGFSSDAWQLTAGASQSADAYGRIDSIGGTDTLWYSSFYFYLDDVSGLTNAEYLRFLHWYDDANADKGNVNLWNDGGTLKLRMTDCVQASNVIYSGLVEATPYRVDTRTFLNAGSGYYEARLYYWDGAAWTELTSGWTGSTSLNCSFTNGFDDLKWGIQRAMSLDENDKITLDCLMVDNDTAQYP